jgi:DNA topoisomerase-1
VGASGGTTSDDPVEVAHAAGLTYVSDEEDPGFTRRKQGKGFSYRTPDGRVVDAATRERIEALAIPPAWTEVWIAVDPDAHIQVTGRDDRDRKQYLYHERWRLVRDAMKFERLAEFALRLPTVREDLDGYLRDSGLTRQRVLAAVTRLLDTTFIRVGNEEYAADNETYGATTLLPEHVVDEGRTLALEFTGKGGIEWAVPVTDAKVRKVIRQCLDTTRGDLFCYEVDGEQRDVTSDDVNQFLREIAGESFSAKDFRTWGGTANVTGHLGPLALPTDPGEIDAGELAAIDAAAELLGNTRAVARTCYVAPQVPASWRAGELVDIWKASRKAARLTRPERAAALVLGND